MENTKHILGIGTFIALVITLTVTLTSVANKQWGWFFYSILAIYILINNLMNF